MAGIGYAPTNDTERGLWNKGLKSLRQSDATPDEIARRCVRYRDRYGPEIPLHPLVLAKHWTSLAELASVTVFTQSAQEVSHHAPDKPYPASRVSRTARAGGQVSLAVAGNPRAGGVAGAAINRFSDDYYDAYERRAARGSSGS